MRLLVVVLLGATGAIDLSGHPELVDAQTVVPELQVELKYATTDNFVKRNLYGTFRTCYLHRDAAAMLARADAYLRKARPDLRLHAYDCLRPRRVQRVMWDAVKGTPSAAYVADPNTPTGSIHNYGCAIDLTLAAAGGAPLDMGTPYDHFGEAAHPRKEIALLGAGQLTAEQVANRLLLREVMVRAGFLPLSNEWWHFNCASARETRKRYRIVD